jgi:multicomponent Na+:H+ antiporter subunit E
LFLFAGLLGFWLILTGTVDAQRLVSGALVALLVTWFTVRKLANEPADRETPVLTLLVLRPGFVRYVLRLLVEIVKSNWMMVRIVLARDMPVSPHFVLVRTRLRHNLTRVIYATSITLTPGTISVNLQGDELVVHAITRDAAAGVRGWAIEDRVLELEQA